MDADKTVKETNSPAETVRETQGGAQATLREGPPAAAASAGMRRFREYDVLGQLPTSGGESDIYIVGRGPYQFILKLYRYKVEPKAEVARRIMALGAAHPHELIRVFEFGFDETAQRWFEIQEYAAGGTLRQIAGGIPLSDTARRSALLRSFLREVSGSLKVLHENGVLHLDLKPANVLARSLDPLDFVLIDFGISNTLDPELSKKFTAVRGTPMYQSPESWSGAVGEPSDWWSLGMMALEIANGRHPFEGLSQNVIASLLMTKAVEIPDSTPDLRELRELLQGLLTRDTATRWGYKQVSRWLAGERGIPVYFEQGEPAAQGDGSPRPLAFMGQKHTSVQALARAIAADEMSWEKGRELLMRGNIRSWLEGNGEFERAVDMDSLTASVTDPDERLFRFVHRYGSPLPLIFMGVVLTLNNLLFFLDRHRRNEEMTRAERAVVSRLSHKGLPPLIDFYLQQNEPSPEMDELKWICAGLPDVQPWIIYNYLEVFANLKRSVPPEQFVGWFENGMMNEIEAALILASKEGEATRKTTALMYAISNRARPETVEALLRAGGYVNAGDIHGVTPLMAAVRANGHPQVTAALLEAGAYIHAVDEGGNTAFSMAVRDGASAGIVSLLLAAGAEVREEDAQYYIANNAPDGTEAYRRLDAIAETYRQTRKRKRLTALAVAAAGAVITLAALLLVSLVGNPSPESLNARLFEAIGRGANLERLIRQGADVNARDYAGQTPLMRAVVSHPDGIPLLIGSGAEADATAEGGRTPLMLAVESGARPEALRALIAGGADVNRADDSGRTPLAAAASPEAAALLIESGAKVDAPDKDGRTPLMAALNREGGAPGVTSLLIARGAKVNAKDRDGRTPLIYAAERGNRDSLAEAVLLIEKGAAVNAKDNSGRTPLMYAAAQATDVGPALVSLLLKKSADVGARDGRGRTPLMFAAEAESGVSAETVSLLIRGGANVNAKDSRGVTALMLAAAGSGAASAEAVSLLLIAGADAGAKDIMGKTASSIAQSPAIKRLLRSAGGAP